MSFDGRAVANYVLDYCEKRNRAITNMSLQKIVFFCHVWSLIELKKPLVRHQFEAWQHGPVLQYLYHEFKAYDRHPITSRATALDIATGQKKIATCTFDDKTSDLLKNVIEFYSQLSAIQLREMSHVKGGPWDQVWNHAGSVNPGMKVADEKIVAFYSKAVPQLGIQ